MKSIQVDFLKDIQKVWFFLKYISLKFWLFWDDF
jgi:hypothetical protein